MNNCKKYLITALVFCAIVSLLSAQTVTAEKEAIADVGKQLLLQNEIFEGSYPEYTIDGKWLLVDEINWFAGFHGGSLWIQYELTGDSIYKELALKEADKLIPYQTLDTTHDLGFIFLPTCVKAYQVTKLDKYKNAALNAAKMLLKRYNEKVKFIRAWGKLGSPKRAGWMIIDTMMNLELLFWAYEQTGNKTFYDIAVQHANTAMKELIRKDFSSYHVIEFDPLTGNVLKKRTHQGFSDESTWARGQAWGIYGFAKAYNFTKDTAYLNTSMQMADYFLSKLPGDHIPFWDLDLSGNDIVRDASAGAIAACGMFLLNKLLTDSSDQQRYFNAAKLITNSLTKNYLFTNSNRPVEQGILLHTVYNHNKDKGVDESYPCGDYYYMETLSTKIKLEGIYDK